MKYPISPKQFLLLLCGALFIVLTACACFGGKEGASYIYDLDGDEYKAVKQLLEDAEIERDTVEALAKAADQSKVFDSDGNTGWAALMDDIDDGLQQFEGDLEKEEVFGAYTEDMTGDLAGAACAFHSDPCQDYYVVNLDQLTAGTIATDCPTHEGIHDIGSASHSSDLKDLMETLGGYYVYESSFWTQVVSDQDVPYDSSFFYDVTDDAYNRFLWACGLQIDWNLEAVESGERTVEEAETSLRENYVDNGCEEVLEDAELNIYPTFEEGFDVFGITEEELQNVLEDELCPIVTELCEEMIDEAGFESAETENDPPEADLYVSDRFVEVDETILFDGRDSTDSDGSIVSYEFDFGDGETDTETNERTAYSYHRYSSSGTYEVTLTITDDDGSTDTDTVTITVTEKEAEESTATKIPANISIPRNYSFFKT